ncbi:MAG: chromate transporter [Ruminococcaceae bacterium]|nr:chromate transporter [Oscillospiraceae bacterium]
MIFLELFLMFMKLGAFTFGGGAAMMPFLEDEVVGRGWLTAEEFVDFVAISESTPGPFAVNIATYIGSIKGVEFGGNTLWGILGAACATLGLVLPSFVIILLIARFYDKFKESRLVKGAMNGLKPVSIGLIAAAVLSIGQVVLFPSGFAFSEFLTYNFITSLLLFAAMFVLCLKKAHPILIVTISGVVGIGFGFLEKLFV